MLATFFGSDVTDAGSHLMAHSGSQLYNICFVAHGQQAKQGGHIPVWQSCSRLLPTGSCSTHSALSSEPLALSVPVTGAAMLHPAATFRHQAVTNEAVAVFTVVGVRCAFKVLLRAVLSGVRIAHQLANH